MYTPLEDVVFYFGSFDPITNGHLFVIEEVQTHVHPRIGIVLIPAWHHIWGKALTSFEHRFAMLRITLESATELPNVSVSSIESENQLSGATIETLRLLIPMYPPTTKCAIVLGSDALASFSKWKEWQAIFDMCHVYVVPRGSKPVISDSVPLELQSYLNKNLFLLPTNDRRDEKDFSSTTVRKELRRHRRSSQLHPEVAAYIQEHELYL